MDPPILGDRGPPGQIVLLTITAEEQPPLRFIAGADAIETAEQQIATLKQQIEDYREPSSSLAIDGAEG
jgi:hypothetical protein